jgi:hypothetical protein
MHNDIFKQNPELNEVFETADGNSFYLRNAAENHAKTLKDKKITRKTNPSKEVSEVDIDAPENAPLGLIQTGEDKDGNPDLKQIIAKVLEGETAELAVVPVNDAPIDKTDNVVELPFAAEIETTKTEESLTHIKEVLEAGQTGTEKLTAKQLLQADYKTKFGETPAEQFTKNQLSEAIATGKKLEVEPLNKD